MIGALDAHDFPRHRAIMRMALLSATLVTMVALPAAADVLTSVEPGFAYLHHTRHSDAPLDTTEKGAVPTIAIAAQLDMESWFARLRFTALGGRTDYQVWDPTTDVYRTDTANTWLSPELAVGGRVEVDEGVQLIEYVGLAYHSWARALDTPGNTTWFQRWGALAIGTRFEARVAPRADLAIEGALVPSFLALVRLEHDVYATRTMSPTGKLGGRAEVTSTYRIGERFRLGLRLSWQYTAFGESPPVALRMKDGAQVIADGVPVMSGQPAEWVHVLAATATAGWSW